MRILLVIIERHGPECSHFMMNQECAIRKVACVAYGYGHMSILDAL